MISKTRTLLWVLSALLLSAAYLPAAPKPNIVHIMVDDLGWQDIASHKEDDTPVYETPHLDRLTRDGRRFTDAYSPAPTCAPSRCAFLRGQYPSRNGIYHVMGGQIPRPHNDNNPYIPPFYKYGLPVEEPTVAEALKEAGYVSCHVGKWHAGGKSAGYPFAVHQGFDYGFSEKFNGRNMEKYFNDDDLWPDADRVHNSFFGSWSRMKPDRLSDFATPDRQDPFTTDSDGRPFDKPLDIALGFISKFSDKPFFLNFAPFYVHGPIQTRDRARMELYCKKMGYDFPSDPGAINQGKAGHSNPYYASMVDTVDWMIGQVVNLLEATDDPRNPGHKLIENTYIIIDSDNGGWIGSSAEPITDNSPLYGGKMTTFEGGIRIPFIVRGPGVEPGSVCRTPINLIDLFPTFMHMAGLVPAKELQLDGCNILPLIQGKSETARLSDGSIRESIFWYYPIESHMSAVVRKGDWKLLRNYGIGMQTREGVQLFRLVNEDGSPADPGEKTDLSEKYPEIRDALLAELDAHLADAGAAMPTRNLNSASDAEKAASPGVLKTGSQRDTAWAEFETGADKVGIQQALFLYTLTPQYLEATGGRREEWFSMPAKLSKGRVEARVPPGATHGVFYMVDANGFQVLSEPAPSFQTVGTQTTNSQMLENGFAYKPGLYSLISLAEKAMDSSRKSGLSIDMLQSDLIGARQAYGAENLDDILHCNAIRALRAAIRSQEGIPESADWHLNRFPIEPLF